MTPKEIKKVMEELNKVCFPPFPYIGEKKELCKLKNNTFGYIQGYKDGISDMYDCVKIHFNTLKK